MSEEAEEYGPPAPGRQEFIWGGIRWKLLGEQIGRVAHLTDRELVDLGSLLGCLVEEHFNVPEADRVSITIELCEALRDAMKKIGVLTRH